MSQDNDERFPYPVPPVGGLRNDTIAEAGLAGTTDRNTIDVPSLGSLNTHDLATLPPISVVLEPPTPAPAKAVEEPSGQKRQKESQIEIPVVPQEEVNVQAAPTEHRRKSKKTKERPQFVVDEDEEDDTDVVMIQKSENAHGFRDVSTQVTPQDLANPAQANGEAVGAGVGSASPVVPEDFPLSPDYEKPQPKAILSDSTTAARRARLMVRQTSIREMKEITAYVSAIQEDLEEKAVDKDAAAQPAPANGSPHHHRRKHRKKRHRQPKDENNEPKPAEGDQGIQVDEEVNVPDEMDKEVVQYKRIEKIVQKGAVYREPEAVDADDDGAQWDGQPAAVPEETPHRQMQKVVNERAKLSEKELFWLKVKKWLKRRRKMFVPWQNAINVLECNFGTGVASFFIFLRWTIFLNFILTALWVLIVILPAALHDTKGVVKEASWLDWITGTAKMGDTWLYYGGYPEKVTGWNMALAYTICIYMTFIASAIAVVMTMGQRLRTSGDTALVKEDKNFPFTSVLFGSWNHAIKNPKVTTTLSSGIANRIKEIMADTAHKEMSTQRTFKDNAKIIARRIIGGFLSLVILAAALTSTLLVVFRVDNNELLAPAVVSLWNFAIPLVVEEFARLENYSGLVQLKLSIARIYIGRMANVLVLLYGLNSLGKDASQCRETLFGQLFWRIFLLDTLLNIVLTVVIASGQFVIFNKKVDFQIARNVMDTIYRQSVVWLGCVVCPLLPPAAVVTNAVIFYVKKFTVMTTGQPPTNPYSASRADRIFLASLAITLLFTLIPMSFWIVEMRQTCGPHARTHSIYAALRDAIADGPFIVRDVAFVLKQTPLWIAVVLLLLILLYIRQMQLEKVTERYREALLEWEDEHQDKIDILRGFRERDEKKLSKDIPAKGNGSGPVTAAVSNGVFAKKAVVV